jgi:3-hydroxyacyl-[acyl-carrier-protein] dehydratase
MVTMDIKAILDKLPYDKPFRFVDDLQSITENGVTGTYFFDDSHDFYKGHFKRNPVTPGVILTECMAQIGLVCLGIFLLNDNANITSAIALTSIDIEFLKPVYPNEKVTVVSEKVYFRFGKLKCSVMMKNSVGESVCTGTIAGMMITNNE